MKITLYLPKAVFVTVVLWPGASQAQKLPPQLWAGYLTNVHLNSRWNIVTDLQVRTLNYTTHFSQRSVRAGLVYKVNETLSYGASLSFFQQIQTVAGRSFYRNEWRPSQEIIKSDKFRKTAVTGRLRSEERFIQQLSNGKLSTAYRLVWRLMLRLEAQHPIVRDNLFVGAGHDLFLLPTSILLPGFEEHTRSYAGINWKASQAVSIQGQYMIIHRRTSPTLATGKTNVARLTFFHKLSMRGGKASHG